MILEDQEVLQMTPDLADHAVLMIQSVREINAQHVLELGTARGDSARILALGLEKTGGRLTTLDKLPPYADPQEWLTAFKVRYPKTIFIEADSTQYQWNEEIDLLFIDSSHIYSETIAELNKHGPWVKPGGSILLHDTQHTDGPSMHTNSPNMRMGMAVTRAIQEWTHLHKLVWTNYPGRWGMGKIFISKDLRGSRT